MASRKSIHRDLASGNYTEVPAGDTLAGAVEIGAVQAFRFPASEAWLPLEGGTFAVNSFPQLGALYGGVPGGNFTVDDFRGRAIYAADATNPAGTKSGVDSVDLAHTHGVGSLATNSAGDHNHTTGTSGTVNASLLGLGLGPVAPANHTHSVSTAGAHVHGMTGSTASGLGVIDKRPARGYLRLYIRALH